MQTFNAVVVGAAMICQKLLVAACKFDHSALAPEAIIFLPRDESHMPPRFVGNQQQVRISRIQRMRNGAKGMKGSSLRMKDHVGSGIRIDHV